MAQRVRVLVGTVKGLFLLEGNRGETGWALRGPFCDGWPVNHAIADPESGAIWAAAGGDFFGSAVWRSRDGGENWTRSLLANGQIDDFLASDPEAAAYIGAEPSPPAPFKGEISELWALARSGGRLYAGAKPAELYVSTDDGDTWDRIDGLSSHPSRGSWQPGGAGLVLHSIVTHPEDPARLWVGISAAGILASEDGGATWERRNRLANDPGAHVGAEPHGHAGACGADVGYCVHNMVRAPAASGDLLYQQNHHGVFRSPDGGRSWHEVTAGLPSNFGFPIAVHPHDPDTLWVVPMNGDMAGRFPPDAAAAVWKSSDGGATWSAQRQGLPQSHCYFTVLRQAMAVDDAPGAGGVYFGTNTGSLYASDDGGQTWQELARHLPAIRSVETVLLD